MPQAPSSNSFHLRKQARLFPKCLSKSLTDLTKGHFPRVTVAELLKPHDIIPQQNKGIFRDIVTLVFETKDGVSKLELDELCGRQVYLYTI